jgi:hypothetical protein
MPKSLGWTQEEKNFFYEFSKSPPLTQEYFRAEAARDGPKCPVCGTVQKDGLMVCVGCGRVAHDPGEWILPR